MARKSNPTQRYYAVPYHAYEEGSYVGMQGVVVKARSKRDLLDAIDMETHEGDFPPELVAASETDTFSGSSVERAGDGMYYIAGFDPEDEDEIPTYVVRYSEPSEHASREAAEEELMREWKVYTPSGYYAVDRGGLREVKARTNPADVKSKSVARRTNHAPRSPAHALAKRLIEGG